MEAIFINHMILENGNYEIGIHIADLQGRYLLNTSNNLSLFGGFTFRKFSPNTETLNFENTNSVWFSLGVEADLFNWYFDF